MKVVGDGRIIAIWKDPWVPKVAKSCVFPRENYNEDALSFVNELSNGDGWNRVTLGLYFNEWEREAIIKIPLSLYPCEDQWVWKLKKHGDFTVRIAYFAKLNARRDGKASNSTNEKHQIRVMLWGAKLPPKIRHSGR